MIEHMITFWTAVGLFIFGSALGSFAAASVWRLRAHQLLQDEKHGASIPKRDKQEVRALMGQKHGAVSDRSRCLHCGRQLNWYDLLPVVSWVSTGGKCRTCKKPIGKMEILAEVGLGLAFVLSYAVWPYEFTTQGIVFFVLWCVVLVLLAIHWMYDAKWFLLLDKITLVILVCALLFAGLKLADLAAPLLSASLLGIALTLLALPGFYGLLFLVSRGAWVGLGDVKLLVPFALMLPSWQHAVLLIFLANLIGSLTLLPALLTKRLTRTTRVPFGPFLILAFVITFLFGSHIVAAYLGAFLL